MSTIGVLGVGWKLRQSRTNYWVTLAFDDLTVKNFIDWQSFRTWRIFFAIENAEDTKCSRAIIINFQLAVFVWCTNLADIFVYVELPRAAPSDVCILKMRISLPEAYGVIFTYVLRPREGKLCMTVKDFIEFNLINVFLSFSGTSNFAAWHFFWYLFPFLRAWSRQGSCLHNFWLLMLT